MVAPPALKSMIRGWNGVPALGPVALPEPMLLTSVVVQPTLSRRLELEFWNGPAVLVMSYGALLLVGSVTLIVATGVCPGAVLVTLTTVYWNFAMAVSTGV